MKRSSRLFNSVETKIQVMILSVSILSICAGVFVYAFVQNFLKFDVLQVLEKYLFAYIIIMISLNIVLSAYVHRVIARPVNALSKAIDDITNGRLQTKIPYKDSRSEIGQLALKIHELKKRLLTLQELEIGSVTSRIEVKDKRAVSKINYSGDNNFKALSQNLLQAAQNLKMRATTLAENIDSGNRNLNELGSAVSSIEANTYPITNASIAVSTAFNLVNNGASHSARIAQSASEKAKSADTAINELSNDAEKVTTAINILTDITEQVNLLALNAAIEAARAGDEGKGFSIIAGEVKALAAQTSNATKELSKFISSLQSQTGEALTAVREVSAIANEVYGINQNLTDTVQSQQSVVKDLVSNLNEASKQAANITAKASATSKAFSDSVKTSEDIIIGSNDITSQAQTLDGELNQFILSAKS